MCLLTYLPPNTLPNTAALLNGAGINNDGHGYAIVIPATQTILVRRSLNPDYLIDRFLTDRTLHPFAPALFHSRYGTSGSSGKYNCHPFYVSPTPTPAPAPSPAQTVIAHNGILPTKMHPSSSDPRCDTRYATETLLTTAFGHLSSPTNRHALAKAISSYNKLVILTTDPAYPSYSYIINESSGIWDEGIWYSNFDYLPAIPNPPSANPYSDCPLCQTTDSIDVPSQTCLACNSCLDCSEDLSTCSCYFFDPPLFTDYN